MDGLIRIDRRNELKRRSKNGTKRKLKKKKKQTKKEWLGNITEEVNKEKVMKCLRQTLNGSFSSPP